MAVIQHNFQPKMVYFGLRKVANLSNSQKISILGPSIFEAILIGHILCGEIKGILILCFQCVKKDGVFKGSVKYVAIFLDSFGSEICSGYFGQKLMLDFCHI